MNNRLVILDRDGVINRLRPRGVADPAEWQALPGSLDAIAQLCRADYRVAVVTNQSGIGAGRYSINTLNRIHRKMLDELQPRGGVISAVFFCPHTAEAGCACRKPKPGLFLELAERLRCNLREVYAVGDSLRDLQAAARAGARPVLVKTGNGKKTATQIRTDPAAAEFTDVPTHQNLAAFTNALLSGDNDNNRDGGARDER